MRWLIQAHINKIYFISVFWVFFFCLAFFPNFVSADSLVRETKDGGNEGKVILIMNSLLRIGIFTFLSAVFAGLTLGVMCADIFTLEIVAESGPMPLCTYAQKIIPLRKQGHKTLCTLIISNMLFNVLIVQEFNHIFSAKKDSSSRSSSSSGEAGDEGHSSLSQFLISTLFIVFFTELIPMSICKSSYSLRVAAAGSVFVRVAMVLTYPIAVPLGKLLDFIVSATESGQIFDKNELRRLMILHYDRETDKSKMPKTELKLLLAAMDFQESCVGDIMTPLEDATIVREDEPITSDFVERIWMSGRSRILVRASNERSVRHILMAKDLMGFRRFKPGTTVLDVVQGRRRPFAAVGQHIPLPIMLKFFQDAKIHMAVVLSEEGYEQGFSLNPGSASISKRLQRDIGIITLEDVVEKMLNDQIYDEYDTYNRSGWNESISAVTLTKVRYPSSNNLGCFSCLPYLRPEPATYPRVNFYSYFTHPEKNVPLTDAQIWAAAYFLQRAVKPFAFWTPSHIHLLLCESKDQQFKPVSSTFTHDEGKSSPNAYVSNYSCETEIQADEAASGRDRHMGLPSNISHQQLQEETPPEYILYKKGVPADFFVLVLGGVVDVLLGDDCFHSSLHIFDFVGENALLLPLFIPEFTAVVRRPARVYIITRKAFDDVYELLEKHQQHASGSPQQGSSYCNVADQSPSDFVTGTASPNDPLVDCASAPSHYGSVQ